MPSALELLVSLVAGLPVQKQREVFRHFIEELQLCLLFKLDYIVSRVVLEGEVSSKLCLGRDFSLQREWPVKEKERPLILWEAGELLRVWLRRLVSRGDPNT